MVDNNHIIGNGNLETIMLSFKDFTPVQYTGGESEQQDLNAFKRKRRPMDEENDSLDQSKVEDPREKKRKRLIKKPMIKVSVTKPIGYRIASIGAGGREYNVKTQDWPQQK